MILDILEIFHEQFQLWLMSVEPVQANDNPSESKEGWRE